MKYHLIIIGGGPAGITAGIYASRQNLKTLLITKDFGGQMARKAVEIENYPGLGKVSGLELIQRFEKHLNGQEITIKKDEISRVEKKKEGFAVLTKKNKKYESFSLIIASGGDPRPLEVPGEKEFIGKGVSYCVTCDGPLFKDKNVAVIGGGNAGFEAAIFLSKIARKIFIFESSEEPKADAQNQKEVKKIKKITLLTNVLLKEIQGRDFVEAILYQKKDTRENFIVPINGIFIEIGSQPATSFVKGLVDFNERDEIKVDFETYATKTPGIFAAGDCNVGRYKQIVTACGEGAKAALGAYDYLRKNKILK